MIRKHYHNTANRIDHYRHQLLLLATLLVLILTAFSGGGLLSEILLVISLSFLFIQSLVAVKIKKSLKITMRLIAVLLIFILGLQPAGVNSVYIDLARTLLFILFIGFILSSLFRYISKAKTVSTGVLITSVNVYLLFGIVSAMVGLLFNQVYPDAYNFPDNIGEPGFHTFLYFTFITMSTVGFGDITPRIPETQFLAYLTAICGQLYVAMAIALLVGKFLTQVDRVKSGEPGNQN